MDDLYRVMAKVYDTLNEGLDYESWADFCENAFKSASALPRTSLVLDAACGTGSMTLALARRGYDMTGVDLSPEMLSVARERADREGLSDKILFLCQDLGALDLYGTVDAVCCCLDSFNHLTEKETAKTFLSLLHRCFLAVGGVLVFDVNTPYKFRHVYGYNDYILEDEGFLCAWRNTYDEQEKLAEFSLSLFEEGKDGRYTRTDMVQEERCYSMAELKTLLRQTGFEIVGVYGDTDGTPASHTDERWYFVCRNTGK